MNPDFTIIRLVPDIRLRREYFGGLIYDTRNGNTLEVDNSTFQFLDLVSDKALKVNDALTFLVQGNIIRKPDKSIAETLKTLFELKIIEKSNEAPSCPGFRVRNWIESGRKPWLSAPETVHWAVTYRCDENCPDCYTRRFSFIKKELNTSEALKLIDKIGEWNVFQLAIGGGEPFARKDLEQLVHHAAARGLAVHITTGKLYIDHRLLESMSPSIKTLQLGIQPEVLIGPHSGKSIQQIENVFVKMQEVGITPGVNLFLTKSVIEQLENLIKILQGVGFNRIILIRYKPPASVERWKSENPSPRELKGLDEKIGKIVKRNPQLNIRVDCALSFVLRHLPKKLTRQLGIKGCVAADRILALAPDGSVYPCSQLVHPSCCAGNLLEFEPELLWAQSRILGKYRSFRTKKAFIRSWCGICRVKHNCGGCRVFASDGLGGDPGCPEPLLPPPTQLGKIGRSQDLAEYLKGNDTISVGEYMERYRVEQRKAIRELNTSPDALSTIGKSARRKGDTYKHVEKDLILDIQNSIGYTPGGFPFASYEQISEWIESSSYLEGYPKWIKQQTQTDKNDLFVPSRRRKGARNNEDLKYT